MLSLMSMRQSLSSRTFELFVSILLILELWSLFAYEQMHLQFPIWVLFPLGRSDPIVNVFELRENLTHAFESHVLVNSDRRMLTDPPTRNPGLTVKTSNVQRAGCHVPLIIDTEVKCPIIFLADLIAYLDEHL